MATKKKITAKAGAKKTSRTAKATKATGERMSQMAAAERVLSESGEPMNCKAMASKGYWSSPASKTPLQLSMLRCSGIAASMGATPGS